MGGEEGTEKGAAGEQLALIAVTTLAAAAVAGAAVVLHRLTGNQWWFLAPALMAAVVVGMINRAIGYSWLGWDAVDPEGVRVGVAGPPERLDERMYRECEAMAEHALSSGTSVPPEVLQTLGDLAAKYPKRLRPRRGSPAPAELPQPTPPNGADYARLGAVHKQLAAIVAPATPRSLRIINEGQYNRVLAFLGRVRLVRYMIYVAVVLLTAFVFLAMKADFGADQGVFGATGSTKVFNALELVAAAGLGAIFYGLYKANRFISNGSYDPKYEASYWVRFTLGVVGGILLAVVLDLRGDLTKPVLALLGGFAAEAVYKILVRFVEMLETLVDGSPRRPADDAGFSPPPDSPGPGGDRAKAAAGVGANGNGVVTHVAT